MHLKFLAKEFKHKRTPSNLLPFQRRILEDLRRNHGIIIASTNRGSGPCAIELERYIRDALVHLLNDEIYKLIPDEQALAEPEELKEKIDDWLTEYEDVLEDEDHTYITPHLHNNQYSFGYFYLLYKIHKHKLPSLENVELCPTRPVCSSCGSIDHPLGAWVNKELQPVAQAQPSFIKNSEALLKAIREVLCTPNSFIFSADATGMYTDINTDIGLDIIPQYLQDHAAEYEYNAEALIAALEIVFCHNLFRFGDAYTKQKSGTAMGKRPAPPWATLFFAIHDFVPQFSEYLLFYKRYLNDIIGIWLAHPDPATNLAKWNEFRENSIPPGPISSGQPTSMHNSTSLVRYSGRPTRFATIESND